MSRIAGAVALLLALVPLLINKPELSADSYTYLSTAQNLVDGHGFVAADGHRITEFAPLYPLVLSALVFLGLSATSAAIAVNALSLVSLLIICHRWLAWRVADERVRLGALLAIGVGYPVAYCAQWAWSEPLFLVFATGALAFVDEFVKRSNRRDLILSIAFTAGACATRYAGVFVLLTCLLYLLSAKRWKPALLVGILGTAPLLLWRLANGDSGERGEARISFVNAVGDAFDITGKWFVGSVPVLAILVGAALIGLRVFRPREPAAMFVGIYFTGIVFLAGVATGISAPNDRLMSPLYPALIVALATALPTSRRVRVASAVWLVATCAGAVAFSISRAAG